MNAGINVDRNTIWTRESALLCVNELIHDVWYQTEKRRDTGSGVDTGMMLPPTASHRCRGKKKKKKKSPV